MLIHHAVKIEMHRSGTYDMLLLLRALYISCLGVGGLNQWQRGRCARNPAGVMSWLKVTIHKDFQCSLCKIVVKHWDMCRCVSRCGHLVRLCARLPDLGWVLDEDSAIHELVQTVALNCSFG